MSLTFIVCLDYCYFCHFEVLVIHTDGLFNSAVCAKHAFIISVF